MSHTTTCQILSYDEEHCQLLAERWPALWQAVSAASPPPEVYLVEGPPDFTLSVDGILLGSTYDARKEAALLAGQVAEDAPEVWVYGVGNGLVQRQLLERAGLQQLMVVPLSMGVFRESLRYFDHRDWLADPRVELVDPRMLPELFGPFVAVPPCLILAGGEGARLRDLLVLELDSEYLHAFHAGRRQLYQQRIRDNRPLMGTDGSASDLLGTLPGGEAIVVAAGPSLRRSLEWISAHREGKLLISVDAALASVVGVGLVPDIVVTTDANAEILQRFFAGDLSGLGETRLIYFPVVDGEVLGRWPGRRSFVYSHADYYESIRRELPGITVFSSGSVLHVATDLAVQMGCARVYLAGADFGFPGGELHAHEAASEHLNAVTAQERDGWVMDGHGGRIATIPSYRGYLRDLERYIASHRQVAFVNLSRDGAAINGAVYPD